MDVVNKLREIVGEENVSDDELVKALHVKNAIGKVGEAIAVVFPENTEQVAKIVKFCYKNGIKIYPQGSSTELSASSTPHGGIVISFSKMNSIEEINITDGYAVVQPGVRLVELEDELNKHGYMFPVDPGSLRSATVGGAINTGAGGMRGAKYGTMVDWVLGLDAVLPTGEIINIGSKTLKCRQGYNLTKLIVGSEGTLCLVTKAILKIVPMPENIVYAAAFFETAEKAMAAVAEIRKRRILPAVMEFLDEDVVRMGREMVDVNGEGNMLIIGVECNHEASERIASTLNEILSRDASKVIVAKDAREAEEKNLMGLRRAFYPLAIKLGSEEFKTSSTLVLIEDFAVPVSRLPEAIKAVKEIGRKYDFTVLTGGHVGDGNIHPMIWTSPEDKDMLDKAEKFYIEVMEVALKLGGTVSAEHGIGEMKKLGLEMEMKCRNSEKALEIMREIKKVFDPKNILNPGKVI